MSSYRATCGGAGRPPATGSLYLTPTGRRGECRGCGTDYHVTKAGHVRVHREAYSDDSPQR